MIPPEDRPLYATLSDAQKRRLSMLMHAMQMIAGADTVEEGCVLASERFAGQRGMSAPNLKRLFLRYRKNGWTCLVTMGAAAKTALPSTFVEYWRALGESNGRKWAPAWRELRRRWAGSERVPGYGTWREWWVASKSASPLPLHFPGVYPDGWSYANLMLHASTKAETAAARRGVAAAGEYLPCIPTDTSALLPLQCIVFDDVRLDFKVCAFGQICELWALVAMDLATRKIIRFGLRPRLEREDGTKESILRRDMQHLIVGILREDGYLRSGTELHVENASAAISTPFEEALKWGTGGSVTVSRTRMITGQVFYDGFPDSGSGNYKGKSWLESYFNLLHNELAALPGQIGSHYSERPAEFAAREREARQLAEAHKRLPFELQAQLRWPIASIDHARQTMEEAFQRIDTRTDHAIKGFESVTEWRLKGTNEWLSSAQLATLPESIMSHVETRQRKESPQQRWSRLFPEISEKHIRLHEANVADLLADHKVITYTTPKALGFQHKGETYRFWRANLETQLKEGAKYTIYFNADDLESGIHIKDSQGRYVASAEWEKGVAWGDREALSRARAEQERSIKRVKKSVADRRETFGRGSQASIEDYRHNTSLLEMTVLPEDDAPNSDPIPARAERPAGTSQAQINAEFTRRMDAESRAKPMPEPEFVKDFGEDY